MFQFIRDFFLLISWDKIRNSKFHYRLFLVVLAKCWKNVRFCSLIHKMSVCLIEKRNLESHFLSLFIFEILELDKVKTAWNSVCLVCTNIEEYWSIIWNVEEFGQFLIDSTSTDHSDPDELSPDVLVAHAVLQVRLFYPLVVRISPSFSCCVCTVSKRPPPCCSISPAAIPRFEPHSRPTKILSSTFSIISSLPFLNEM